MKKQTLLAIVFMVLAVGLAYGGWRVWNEPQEPAQPVPAPETEPQKPTPTVQVPEGWKVYENQLYGYLIRYPQEFDSQSSPADAFVTIYGGEKVLGRGGLPPKTAIKVGISIYKNVSAATVDEWVKTFGPRYQQEGVTTVAGERAIYGKTDVGFDPNPEDDIFVPTGDFGWDLRIVHKGIGYQISYTPYDSELRSIFEQILATFEFTK